MNGEKMRSGRLFPVVYLFIAFTFVTAQTTPVWTHFSPTGAGPRSTEGAQSTAYDSSTDRLIVFGGLDPFSSCCVHSNDTWVLTNATASGGTPQWQQLVPDAPNGLPQVRNANSVVYDAATNRLIVFGGGQFDGFAYGIMFNDVWVLTNANGLGGTPQWIPLTPTGGTPAPREGHGAFYKQATNEMFVFGGGNNGIMSVPNDLWVLKNANGLGGSPTWIQLSQAGAIPGRLEHFALAYDPMSNRMTIAGGCCFYTNATHVLDFNDPSGIPTWSDLFPIGPLPPGGDAQEYGYDPTSNSLIIQGISPGGGTNATWLLSGVNAVGNAPGWSNVIPEHSAGSPPEGIAYTGGAYNSQTNKFILTLNRTDSQGNIVSEVWILSGPALRLCSMTPTFAELVQNSVTVQTTSNTSEIQATFRPNCADLQRAAQIGGYHHFNWLQIVTKDLALPFFAIPDLLVPTGSPIPPFLGIPTVPFIDPPHGGYFYQVRDCITSLRILCTFPVEDSLDWYDDEQYTNSYLIGHPTQLELDTSPNTLSYFDAPSVPLGLEADYETSLVGVRSDGSGDRLNFEGTRFAWKVVGNISNVIERRSNFDPMLGSGTVQSLGFVPPDSETQPVLELLAKRGISIRTTTGVVKPVIIDIQPGGLPNSINSRSSGTIPVAIISTRGFDAQTQPDQASLTFGHIGDERSLAFCHAEDVNNDGVLDLLCHFYTSLANFQAGDIQGTLKGKTVDGISLFGKDSVSIVSAPR
jgi:hypothetical protein